MKKPLCLLPLILAAHCAFSQAQSEPIIQGNPESYWVNLLTNNIQSYALQTKWRSLGTNSMAVLIKAVEKNDGANAAIIRTNAAFILSQGGDAKVLLKIAKNTSDSQVKMWIFNGLVFNADTAVTEVMVSSLHDSDPKVRVAALCGLGLSARQFIPEELPALVKCLQDTDPDVRSGAAMILCSYPISGYTNITSHEIAEAALSEIKKASGNPNADISKAAAKALKELYPELTLTTYAHELEISRTELLGTNWTATVKVVDESNEPITNATVSVGYYVPDVQFNGEVQSGWQDIKGVTDGNGLFTATHKGSSPAGFSAEKAGYYSSTGEHEAIMFKDDDPAKWNPTVTLVLKKKIHPVPMYVNRVDIAHNKSPAFDKPIGFDLTVGDWIAPYGKGTNAYMFFTWHVDYDTNDLSAIFGKQTSHGWDGRLTISFPNPGDGIQEFDSPGRLDNRLSEGNVGSELRSSQEAPADGYQPQLIKTNRWHFGKLGSANDYDHLHKNYFLRVSSVMDKDGHIKSAQYGKIYGDFEEAFTSYLNSEPNSRSIEFDMKHNLVGGGIGFYMTY
jgi:hypothetical protein